VNGFGFNRQSALFSWAGEEIENFGYSFTQ
jgi:hypothetical protein